MKCVHFVGLLNSASKHLKMREIGKLVVWSPEPRALNLHRKRGPSFRMNPAASANFGFRLEDTALELNP